MFRGNYDIYHTVARRINPAIKARYVRIHPKSWNSYIAMRVELYGGRLRGKQLRRKNSCIRQFLDVVEGRKKRRKKEKKEETHAQMNK